MPYLMLDAGPLGTVTHPRPTVEIAKWYASVVSAGHWAVTVAGIADYEVRRELLRAQRSQGLARLDILRANSVYVAASQGVFDEAARLWAELRAAGRPTAPDVDINADVILAAKARLLAKESGMAVTVATTNAKHLALMCDAHHWSAIQPSAASE